MTNASIQTRPVTELLANEQGQPLHYWIPDYQRGYRWQPRQVVQLLDDIWEFIQNSEGGNINAFYCLQPLVIKPHGDRFEVVDGQQRLTTIYILLTYLKELAAMIGKQRFKLSYETRGEANEPFLEEIDFDRAEENVDFWHICEAYKAIENWFEARDGAHKLKFMQHLLNDDEAGRNVKVIWFELSDADDAVAAFTRLNVGKIPLTDDELIRAIFLKRASLDEQRAGDLQRQIASEWDQIEKALQDNEFWYFLSNETDRDQNRIRFVFYLVAQAKGLLTGATDQAYPVFFAFNQMLFDSEETTLSHWREIKNTFMMLEEWFKNRTLYHLVGFLANEGVEISELQGLAEGCNKSVFNVLLRQRIYSRITGQSNPKEFADENIRLSLTELLDKLDYTHDRDKIRSILLLFNISTLLQSDQSTIRFQFDKYKNLVWHIEHVRSVSADDLSRYKDRVDWSTQCLNFLKSRDEEQELCEEIESFLGLSKQDASEFDFDSLYAEIVEVFHENENPETDNTIGNLVLLDQETNQSYKNSIFPLKRERILSLDQAGIFVPICTRNVFLKCYSTRIDHLVFWVDQDREDYQDKILETLLEFFIADSEEQA